jgi:hypothetical protein
MSRLSRSRSYSFPSSQPNDRFGAEVAKANHPFIARTIDGPVERLAPSGRLFGFAVAVRKVTTVKFGPDRFYVDRPCNGPIRVDALVGTMVDQKVH